MKPKAEIKTESVSPSSKRYDEEFQREAVRLLEAGRSVTQLSRELGVSTWSLCMWKKRHGVGAAGTGPVGRSPKGDSEGGANTVALAAELARVRAQLHAVTRQREILNKALSILGQDTGLSTT